MRVRGSAEDPLWYKDAMIYELHVSAFYDSNNDGIGDFQGLIQKLDYLQDLGVTCLWLLPFFPSPLRDDGYDIADYKDVHPSYGTLDDFRQFLDAAHKRGLQVLIELVVNHTSDQHAWFQAARKAPRVRRNATSMSGATPTRSTRRFGSSLPTPRNQTGPGMPKRERLLLAPLLLAISLISISTIPRSSRKSSM